MAKPAPARVELGCFAGLLRLLVEELVTAALASELPEAAVRLRRVGRWLGARDGGDGSRGALGKAIRHARWVLEARLRIRRECWVRPELRLRGSGLGAPGAPWSSAGIAAQLRWAGRRLGGPPRPPDGGAGIVDLLHWSPGAAACRALIALGNADAAARAGAALTGGATGRSGVPRIERAVLAGCGVRLVEPKRGLETMLPAVLDVADSALRSGRPRAARVACRLILCLDAGHGEARQRLAIALDRMGCGAEAVRRQRLKAIAGSEWPPALRRLRLEAAAAQAEAGQWDAALEHAAEAWGLGASDPAGGGG